MEMSYETHDLGCGGATPHVAHRHTFVNSLCNQCCTDSYETNTLMHVFALTDGATQHPILTHAPVLRNSSMALPHVMSYLQVT